MSTDRKTEIAVGALFFLATASYLVGSQLIAPALSAADGVLSLNSTQLRIGVLLEVVNAGAVVGIGVLLFPILRQYSDSGALGYAISRTIESVLLVVSALSALSLVTPGQGIAAASAYNLAFQMAMVALGAGSLVLCSMLYRFTLVPRALSLLGAVGYAALLVSGWIVLFGGDASPWLFAPGAIFEIVFPLWLIVRGFNSPALAALPVTSIPVPGVSAATRHATP